VRVAAWAWVLALWAGFAAVGQAVDQDALVRRVDAANHARYDHVLSYTVTEHYRVFRGNDLAHPAAEMTVLTTYTKGVGKSYEVKSQTGSALILRFGLKPLLENEKALNNPATVENSWFSSANYEMKVKVGATQRIGERDCVALAITPKRKAPNMVEGTLWVDPRDGTIAQVEGVGTKSPNPLSGPAKMMRQYVNIDGYSMAVHARAESDSAVIGRSVMVIEYSDYRVKTDKGGE